MITSVHEMLQLKSSFYKTQDQTAGKEWGALIPKSLSFCALFPPNIACNAYICAKLIFRFQ
jgi:hypothetical protein